MDVVVEVPRGLLWDEQQCLELDITLSLEVNTRQGVLKVLFLREGGGCRGDMETGGGWCEWGILGAICIVREMHIVKPIWGVQGDMHSVWGRGAGGGVG